MSVANILLVALLLAFAAEGAAYPLGRGGGADRVALGTAAIATGTVVGGPAVALTT